MHAITSRPSTTRSLLLLVHVAIGISRLERADQLRLDNLDARDLIAERDPVATTIVRSAEQFNLPGARRQPLDDAIDFIRLVRRVAHLCKQCS